MCSQSTLPCSGPRNTGFVSQSTLTWAVWKYWTLYPLFIHTERWRVTWLSVLKSLPFLVKKVANFELTQFRGLDPFTWHRVSNLYINKRGGDCGPVSAKFLEIHAHGDPEHHMASITDLQVDSIRKQYAIDIYKTLVIPAYCKASNA